VEGEERKGEQSNETAAPTQATETAAFVSDVTTSTDNTSVEHLLLTSDYSHLSFVARSNRWINDSGASEHMAGESLLFDIVALKSVTRITTAGTPRPAQLPWSTQRRKLSPSLKSCLFEALAST
jgi:hypothetical protein